MIVALAPLLAAWIAVGALLAILGIRGELRGARDLPSARVKHVGDFETVPCGFSIHRGKSSTNTTPPFGRVCVGPERMWFTGPLGRRGWPLSRDGTSGSRKRVQLIAEGYRLNDGTLTVDVAPGDDERWLEALRRYGWPMPSDP